MELQTRLPNNKEGLFAAWSVQSGYKEEQLSRVESSFETPVDHDMSLGAEELSWAESWELAIVEYWQERIRRHKEDFMCNLKWQWECYESVAKIWLVKTDDPRACITVNCKVWEQRQHCIACSSECFI
jgi:hypothetical protein